jgi:homoserine kinase
MNEVRVFAPASVANVAVGFDILGFAIHGPGDEVIARFTHDHKGLRIKTIIGLKGKKLPYEVEKNTAGFSALKLLQQLGETDRGIELEIHKKMPFGSGLGSSAASAVAGVFAVNELLGKPLDKLSLLPFAVAGEEIADGAYHADNVAPSLLGGITLIRSNEELDVHAIAVPKSLYASVVYPHVEIFTKDARNILSDTVSLHQAIQQCGNLGGLLVGLHHSDYGLIARSLEDVIIEPQRKQLIPHFDEVKQSALDAGALGCSISGAGPSVFALSNDETIANEIGRRMSGVFKNAGIDTEKFVSAINMEGAIKIK